MAGIARGEKVADELERLRALNAEMLKTLKDIAEGGSGPFVIHLQDTARAAIAKAEDTGG